MSLIVFAYVPPLKMGTDFEKVIEHQIKNFINVCANFHSSISMLKRETESILAQAVLFLDIYKTSVEG